MEISGEGAIQGHLTHLKMFFNFFTDWAQQLDGEISVYNDESLFIFHTNDFLGAQLWLQKIPCHDMFPYSKMIVEALHDPTTEIQT